jgi:hypothetical protein
MNTMKSVAILLTFVGFVLVSCSEKSMSPVDSPDLSLDKLGPIVHAVQGSAHLRYEGKHISQTVSAHEYEDGTVGGTYLQNAQNALNSKLQKWNGDVLFLKIYENVGEFGGTMGVIGGIETTGENPGYYDVFFVIDNGTVAEDQTCYFVNVTPDLAQAEIWWNLPPAELINLLYGILTVDNGNIRVY